MRIDVVTLFPEIFGVVRDLGVTGRAHAQGRWSLHAWNPRDFTHDVHRTVDDRPYGGGPGMVMMAGPLEAAVNAAQDARAALGLGRAPVALLAPVGRRYDQAGAESLAASEGIILICGRYEGVDQRFIARCVTQEISLGDFVLSGGEIAALAVIDAAVRLLPGVLNDGESALQDSFNDALSGLLDSPHYTRPEVYEGEPVPAPLLSGHHANIARWRRERSLELTTARRPELIDAAREKGVLTQADERFLAALAGTPLPEPAKRRRSSRPKSPKAS
ncbi:tRNA (guanosine(37)-N1)-methyltransferase TrmD [Achromobacter insolitus]|uniref:tRNA (guanosine(37)-N1)-methyltransferase TrmD n=1 Tax=Achromobacter insolitus TaxID=217204 RepID=UPI000972C2BC|nr:tRNA (guanosine(37)-N1)-methyltransferase TrmD [Achromobacter insolitus]APX73656.1 tRNA (guanosine(37)-N1)-methyltransferase TrmD [Achromobacter insolitus]OWT54358.1 tRNA (guanosine(37)-N1)-methyltransferase TrmD [Achromobacter insolitus]WKK15967.1 tRNA (guanosine(37)-N1)-methyltransferase TrmD [Achromobacter insolitus]CAB3737552.1 tRNA (guanine-N(1)-)-methyltransferase [Achromobacter insolitus]CAB3958756.1 tRNA (guanine-N(1)-)-methyltransferase [Achromobacter insolitus]